jgi:RimJ/RimL family protein N-acetyltransferase
MPDSLRIETDRTQLRLLTNNDIEGIYNIVRDYPEIAEFMTWRPYEDLAEAHQKALRSRDPEDLLFGVFIEDELIGKVTVRNFQWMQQDSEKRSCFLSFWLSPAYAGKGLGTEVVSAVCRFAFKNLRMRKVFAGIFANNVASGRLLEKVGFVEIGKLRQHYIKDGEYIDSVRYELLESDLRN